MSTSTSLRRTIQNRTVQGFIDASWLSRRRQELRALRYEADWLTRNLGDGSRLLHGTGFGMVAAPCYNGAVDRNLPLDTTIRPARDEDVEAMRQIEREAGGLFAQIGMDDIADDEPLPTDVLLSYVAGERAWVAEVGGRPVGYALAAVVDEAGHLEQISVLPEYWRRGIGRALIAGVVGWARAGGRSGLTLLTFRDVPWNAPYYASLGFRPIPDSDLGPELRSLRVHERVLGLDTDARQAMRLELGEWKDG